MKKTLSLALLTCVLMIVMVLGCAPSNDDGTVIQDGPILESISSDGKLQFNGSVMNNGDYPVRSVFVLITLMDGSGAVIGANSVQVGETDGEDVLFPGERRFFSVTVDSDPSEVVTKNVEIFFDPVADS